MTSRPEIPPSTPSPASPTGAGPLAGVRPAGRRPERALHLWGLGITVALHASALVLAIQVGSTGAQATKPPPPEYISAGLAKKSKSAEGVKTKQPQKDAAPKVKPVETSPVAPEPKPTPPPDPKAPAIATNPDVAPKPPDPKKPPPPPEDIDPNAIFNKHRKAASVAEQPLAVGEGGKDTETQDGRADGSDFGTLADAKGDPYVGELVGRMTTNPDLEVPSVVSDTGLETLGCVKLDADGKVVERWIEKEHKSQNRTFNRAVERRLKITTDMDSPVPSHLKDLLVRRGICVPYRF